MTNPDQPPPVDAEPVIRRLAERIADMEVAAAIREQRMADLLAELNQARQAVVDREPGADVKAPSDGRSPVPSVGLP